MGHIINPNIYRLGKMVPWVSSGFKRKKNERSKVANEDFLIYNFTRNFFIKNHLTITRFNKTFQLNLFFFDRELQNKYILRTAKPEKTAQEVAHQKKVLKLKQILAAKRLEKNKYKNIYLTAPIKIDKQVTAGVQSFSAELAREIKTYITPKRTDTINYSLARDIRKKTQKHERIYIYKDNTFEKNKVKDRLTVLPNIKENETYKQLYSKKLLIKIYKTKYKKQVKSVPNYKFPQKYHAIDSLYFKTQARYANNYLFAKGTQAKQFYNSKKKYIEVIRKNETLGVVLKKTNVNLLNRVDNLIINGYENILDGDKFKVAVKQLKPSELFIRFGCRTLYKPTTKRKFDKDFFKIVGSMNLVNLQNEMQRYLTSCIQLKRHQVRANTETKLFGNISPYKQQKVTQKIDLLTNAYVLTKKIVLIEALKYKEYRKLLKQYNERTKSSKPKKKKSKRQFIAFKKSILHRFLKKRILILQYQLLHLRCRAHLFPINKIGPNIRRQLLLKRTKHVITHYKKIAENLKLLKKNYKFSPINKKLGSTSERLKDPKIQAYIDSLKKRIYFHKINKSFNKDKNHKYNKFNKNHKYNKFNKNHKDNKFNKNHKDNKFNKNHKDNNNNKFNSNNTKDNNKFKNNNNQDNKHKNKQAVNSLNTTNTNNFNKKNYKTNQEVKKSSVKIGQVNRKKVRLISRKGTRNKLKEFQIEFYNKAVSRKRTKEMREITALFIKKLKELIQKQKKIKETLNTKIQSIIKKTVTIVPREDINKIKEQLESISEIKTLSQIQQTINNAAMRQLKQLQTKGRLSVKPATLAFANYSLKKNAPLKLITAFMQKWLNRKEKRKHSYKPKGRYLKARKAKSYIKGYFSKRNGVYVKGRFRYIFRKGHYLKFDSIDPNFSYWTNKYSKVIRHGKKGKKASYNVNSLKCKKRKSLLFKVLYDLRFFNTRITVAKFLLLQLTTPKSQTYLTKVLAALKPKVKRKLKIKKKHSRIRVTMNNIHEFLNNARQYITWIKGFKNKQSKVFHKIIVGGKKSQQLKYQQLYRIYSKSLLKISSLILKESRTTAKEQYKRSIKNFRKQTGTGMIFRVRNKLTLAMVLRAQKRRELQLSSQNNNKKLKPLVTTLQMSVKSIKGDVSPQLPSNKWVTLVNNSKTEAEFLRIGYSNSPTQNMSSNIKKVYTKYCLKVIKKQVSYNVRRSKLELLFKKTVAQENVFTKLSVSNTAYLQLLANYTFGERQQLTPELVNELQNQLPEKKASLKSQGSNINRRSKDYKKNSQKKSKNIRKVTAQNEYNYKYSKFNNKWRKLLLLKKQLKIKEQTSTNSETKSNYKTTSETKRRGANLLNLKALSKVPYFIRPRIISKKEYKRSMKRCNMRRIIKAKVPTQKQRLKKKVLSKPKKAHIIKTLLKKYFKSEEREQILCWLKTQTVSNLQNKVYFPKKVIKFLKEYLKACYASAIKKEAKISRIRELAVIEALLDSKGREEQPSELRELEEYVQNVTSRLPAKPVKVQVRKVRRKFRRTFRKVQKKHQKRKLRRYKIKKSSRKVLEKIRSIYSIG
ncbi:hypothetical protein ACTFIW_003075, partial [Dictyostelium discoideum]